MHKTMEEMVQEIYDRQAIRAVVERYSRGVDRQDKTLLLSCYHPDAIDDHGMFVGPSDDFFDWTMPSHLCLFRTHQHVVANHYCELEGNTAHTETYYMFVGMSVAGDQVSMSGGRYVDRMEKRDGEWKITVRKCVVEWQSDNMKHEGVRQIYDAVGKVTRDREDLSYDRPLLYDPARNGLRMGA